MDGYSRFYNRMEFTINLRKVWEPGAPAIRVPSGGIVEGPYDKLIQYRFLAPLPFDFHKVDSTTSENFAFKREEFIIPQNIPIIRPEDIQVKNCNDVQKEITSQDEQQLDNSDQKTTSTGSLPFDPAKVNWIQVKTPELLQAAVALGIDVNSLQETNPKKKKWEIVRLVKAKLGLVK